MRTTRNAPRTRILMENILLGELTRWHDGRVWFADWIAQKLYSVDPGGGSRLEAEIASLPFSIDWLPDGPLLVVNAAENLLQQRQADGSFVTHTDLSGLSKYGCNEIVVDGRGNIYVNNIDFAFMEEEFRPGFIALITPAGAVRKVAEGLAFPNGMAITPDNRTLVVAESFNGNLTGYDIGEDGSLSNQRIWAKLEGQGGDGLCFDAEGCIWVACGPRCARVREGGEVVDEIPLDRMAFACMLGGDDGRTLFINAAEWSGEIAAEGSKPTGQLLAARVDVPHAGFPRSR